MDKDKRKELYDKYALIRDSKGMTDYRVAVMSEIPMASIYDWKYGYSMPKADKIIKIAKTLGIDPSALLE